MLGKRFPAAEDAAAGKRFGCGMNIQNGYFGGKGQIFRQQIKRWGEQRPFPHLQKNKTIVLQ